jgi:hypothetical protein
VSTLNDALKAIQQTQAWQQQLIAGVPAYGSIARDMATMVAQINETQRVLDAWVKPQIESISAVQRQLTASMAPYQALASAYQSYIENAVRPLAVISAIEFRQHALALKARERDYMGALAAMGWRYPRTMSMRSLMDIGRLAAAGKRLAVRQGMVKLIRGSAARRLAESWMDAPSFKARRRFILDGIRDHRAGRYRVSVPTLLPLIEGIAIEEFKPMCRDTTPKDALAIGRSIAEESLLDAAIVDTAMLLYNNLDFSTVRPTSRQLNRHFVLHGRSTAYGTEENSARVLYHLDQIHALVMAKSLAPEARAS